MKHLRNVLFCTAILALLISAITTHAAGLGTNIAVRLVGTGTAYPSTDLFSAFNVVAPPSDCFDVALVDVKTGNVIGDATDCIAVIGVVGDGLQVVGTTLFHFPGGTVITQGLTTVQPVTHGSPDFTHITGAIPQPGDNNVIYGDGKFANAEGPARLSGTVNLSNLASAGEITFDCVFILDIGFEDE